MFWDTIKTGVSYILLSFDYSDVVIVSSCFDLVIFHIQIFVWCKPLYSKEQCTLLTEVLQNDYCYLKLKSEQFMRFN